AEEPKIDVTPVIQPQSDVTQIIQQSENFIGKDILDKKINLLSKKDLGTLHKEDLEAEKVDAQRVMYSLMNLKKQQYAEALTNTGKTELREKYIDLADKYIGIARDRINKIQDRIKELENNKTKGLVKDLIQGYEELGQQKKKKSSTPELSPGTID